MPCLKSESLLSLSSHREHAAARHSLIAHWFSAIWKDRMSMGTCSLCNTKINREYVRHALKRWLCNHGIRGSHSGSSTSVVTWNSFFATPSKQLQPKVCEPY
mmetsp:Transcript_12324/g.37991  ORF Transcript_12324/g.37991 Transcript_12324/m.37991 type:complete len:102 (-) Transcript_12324:481-786(-)